MTIQKNLDACVQYFRYILLEEFKEINCFIAGGAIRDYFSLGYINSDIDVFFSNEIDFQKALDVFKSLGIKSIYENDNFIEFIHNNKRIQLIKKHWLQNPQESIENFDFTVCSVAVDYNKVYYHETFFMDLAKKRLVINKLHFPISTLQRLQKYIIKGYRICNGGLLEIVKEIQKLDLTNSKSNNIEFYSDGSPRFLRYD